MTTHLYPTDDQAAKTRDGFAARIRETAANVSRLAPHAGVPLVMTEFNAGLGLPTLFVMEGGYAIAELGLNTANVISGFSQTRG